MKQISLTQGKVALVDDEDFDDLSAYKWYAYKPVNSQAWYAGRNTKTERGRRRMTMHVQILRPSPGFLVDHRNRDGLDNRRENLRLATSLQNAQNSTRRWTKKTSRFHGVCWNKARALWQAQIQVNKRKVKIGMFLNEEEAARAYDTSARLHFGEFAVTNFPQPVEKCA